MLVPTEPKIYHIVHVDRLRSIIKDGYLWCDAKMRQRTDDTGTMIGMNTIKQRRLGNYLRSRPGLRVGDCVPFYFSPRSVMLYVIHMADNPELIYRGGQGPILHLEADLRAAVAWADGNGLRWAVTASNAGSGYFEDFSDLARLGRLDWDAIHAKYWSDNRERKQAEFLIECLFDWGLVTRVGVHSRTIQDKVLTAMGWAAHRPPVEIKPDWYY